ncbi:MAG: zinc ribbon domain-containing protein [Planctomycetota bacterium]|nr:zinc ribbon domain-containing protein [Planctomycetota bacterium]
MRSIKPGRGPSLVSAIGSVIALVLVAGWIGLASSIGAPPYFLLFGFAMIVMILVGTAVNLYNATAKNRISTFDITSEDEESDPVASALGRGSRRTFGRSSSSGRGSAHGSERGGHGGTADDEQRDAKDHGDAGARRGQAPQHFDATYCPYCGVEVQPDFEFCPSCGKDI